MTIKVLELFGQMGGDLLEVQFLGVATSYIGVEK